MKTTLYTPDWEPTLINEEIIASGIWWYQDITPYKAELIKRKYDYTSKDLVILDEILSGEGIDYIDYFISDEGIIYLWKFTNENNEESFSNSLSTYFSARDHINTYSGKFEINWK